MAKIGRFREVAPGEFSGSIVTLSVQHQDVRIVPVRIKRDGETPPSHLVFAGQAEVGSGWAKSAGDAIGLKIDDPSFTAPIYPTLMRDEDHEWALFWQRSGGRNT